MKCSECGELADDDEDVCPNCGNILKSKSTDQQKSNKYYCDVCKEELEFISTYKQWYCYNCQKYADLPIPTKITEPPQLQQEQEQERLKGKDAPDEVPPEEEILKPAPEVIFKKEEEGVETKEDADEGASDVIELPDEFESPEEYTDKKELNLEERDEEGTMDEVSWEDAIELQDSSSDEDTDGSVNDAESEKEIDTDEITEETGEVIELEAEFETTSGEVFSVDMEKPKEEYNKESTSDDIILEVAQDYQSPEDYTPTIIPEASDEDAGLKKLALAKLHQAWLRLNSLKTLKEDDERLLQLEADLKSAIDGNLDAKDTIVLATESLEDVTKLEKDIKEDLRRDISELYHFVSAKIMMAKKTGFNVVDLEEELDNVSSEIAKGKYQQASEILKTCLQKISDLPNTQNEILIGLDEQSETIKELKKPYPG